MDKDGVKMQKLRGIPDYVNKEDYCNNGNSIADNRNCVQLVAHAKLPTKYGQFIIIGFHDRENNKDHTALVKGNVSGKENCPVRIHSECHTGDVFHSLKCDCREQLEASLKYISQHPFGVLIYLKQEGRGIGLLNKIKAYQLQDLGLDTIEANEYLGLPNDMRDYSVAAKIIKLLNIKSVSILTNNPDKIEGLEKEGIFISERIPLVIEPNDHNHTYLNTKQKKMGHLL
jgi:GTP cyclohydrolase II